LERKLSLAVLLYFIGYLVLGLRRNPVNQPLPPGRVIAIIPAYNEKPGRLHETIRSLLDSTVVPDVIHVVDDGSAEPLPRYRHPKVFWHRQPNGGKHQAQATALRAEQKKGEFDFVVTVDSDSVVDRHAIERCLRRFSDPTVNAVTGVIFALNRSANLITRVTDLHYAHSCLVVRDGLSRMGDIFTTSGALAVYRASMWLPHLDDYVRLGVADDRHLTHLAQRTGKSVAVSDAYVNTFVPDNVPDLVRQRIRWARDYYRCILMDIKFLHGWSFWMRSFDFVLMVVAPVLVLTAFMVFPFAQWRIPWAGVGLWIAFLYIQTSCYLTERKGISATSRFVNWLCLSPALYLFQYLIVGPAIVVSLFNIRQRSWQTRDVKSNNTKNGNGRPGAGSGRDHWFDFIRMIAIFRVVFFHATGYLWLSLFFPSMGIMFGLGGSLMAASLRKVGDRPEIMIWRRLRRLVPSVWALGAVLIPIMLYMGWSETDDRPFTESALIAWILPLSDPPGNDWAAPITGTLWYIRTYLWLVLLSAPLYALFKRHPRLTLASPFVLVIVAQNSQWNRWITDVCTNLGTFTVCWLIGYAHREGMLDRLESWLAASLAIVAMGVGAGSMGIHNLLRMSIQDRPLAQAFWSAGAVLLFLKFRPRMDWISKPVFRSLRWLVAKSNSRAITIYLWHQLAVMVSGPIMTWMGVWQVHNEVLWMMTKFTIIISLVLVSCSVFGRVEDSGTGNRRRAEPERNTSKRNKYVGSALPGAPWTPTWAPASGGPA
jgi:cellulose synthase/poly-beta-1,6-N-acetylglucosamine synthase-like glycosyltransferase